MNLYELASQDEAWGAFTLDDTDDGTPLSAWPADPPAPMPLGPVPLDAALDAAAHEYGVDADVLRALGHGGSVDSIFDTAASLRSRLEAFDGDYSQALASYREEEGNGGDALAAPAVGPLSPPPPADARMPAPTPVPAPEPSVTPTAAAPRSRPPRPQAATPVPGAPPSQTTRSDPPPAPPDGRLGAADDPRSLLYRQAPAAQKPFVDEVKSQPGSGTDTASFAPVRPEVRQALGNAWDAASPGERQRMQSMPGWQGQLARERAAQYAQADKGVLAASPTAALLDGRAENRAKAPPATGAAPRAGGNERAQANTALPRAVPATVPQRSWGEAFSDTTKSVAQGILDVASVPGVAYSAATGDYDTRYLNAIRGTQEVLQDDKSPALQASAQARQQKLATAEGWREKLAVGGWETLTDPALLGDTVARSGPGMLAGGLFGRAAGSAVDAAGNALVGRTIATGSEAAARSAVALKNAAPAMASGTAVGASAAQQGASVANDLYAELQKLPTSAFAAEPEFQQLAREHGEDKARNILAAAAANRALLVATGASVLSMKLVPGGDAIEKMFLPSHLKGAAREAVKSTSFMTRPLTRGMEGSLGSQALEVLVQRARTAGTESFSEGAEEGSGAIAKGLELSRAGQDVKLDEMAGEAAGQGMALGGVMGGTAPAHGARAAPHVPQQPIRPTTPPVASTARERRGREAHTAGGPASPPPPSPSANPSAALSGYSAAPQPGSGATWSDVAAAAKKAQAEAEILRQAEALLTQEVATSTTATPSPAVPSATPEMPLPASTDGNSSGAQQGANALPQGQATGDAGQAGTTAATDPAANAPGTPAPPPTPSTLNTEAEASAAATEAAPTTTQHGSARHTAAAQVQVPAPIEAQVQALDSGMLVVGGDQATILAHLQAGGVRGAEPFAGVTLVPVDQAALAQRVMLRPSRALAPSGPSEGHVSESAKSDGTAARRPVRDASGEQGVGPRTGDRQAHPRYTFSDDNVPNQPAPSVVRHGTESTSPEPVAPVDARVGDAYGLLRSGRAVDLGVGRAGRAGRGGVGPDGTAASTSRHGSGRFSFREPAQPDDGYSAGTAQPARATAGGARRGGAGQGGRAAPRATLVGLGIAERVQLAGSQALVGERVDSPEQLAELAQVYRDPRYETFRVFFIKAGEVVHATGVSSRLPDQTPMVPAGMTQTQYFAQFRDGMHRTGAQGYYILHNHPSGNPQPSQEDLELTEHLAQQVPGMLGHVIINSNKYAVITPDATRATAPAAMVHLKHFGPDRLLQASKPMAALGQTIPSPDVLAIVGKSMQGPGWMTLVGLGADGHVRAIAEAPSGILSRSPAYLAATVRRFVRVSGSVEVFAVGEAGDINNSPVRHAVEAGILRDAVTDLGQSLANGGRTTARPSNSAQFREAPEPVPVRMEMQRDGTLMVKGDPIQLQERLRQGGVERVLRREGGVLVGLDQVGKARQLLQQPPLGPTSTGSTLPSQSSLSGQQFSRSAPPSPDRPSRARGLPAKPATVQSVRAAVAKLTNSMGLLAEGRGRVVVATSADIQAHWEPLVGEVDMGSQDTGLAQGFFDPNSKTVFLIADHIEAGQEMAVAAHELVHKHGKAVLGEARWRQLHEVIGSWANRPEGSLERRVHDEAMARVQASRPDSADPGTYSSEELFPYAVQVAMELGVQPTALMPNNSVQGWLARVRASLNDVLGKLTGNPQAFDGQDLVDLAFAVAQRENPAYEATPDATTADGIDSRQQNDLPLGRKASALPEGNYAPPPIEEIVPTEILASARETIERLMPLAVETANSDPEALAQAARELQPYIERARQKKPAFDQAVRDVATRAGALGVQLAPVKRVKRASEKMVIDGIPASSIKDLLRATIVVKSYSDAQAVLRAMEFSLKLMKVKNRTNEPLSINANIVIEQVGVLKSGYADVLVVLNFDGIPAEIQINVPPMLSVKEGEAHTLYEIERVMPQGSPEREEANAQARRLQDAARAAASE